MIFSGYGKQLRVDFLGSGDDGQVIGIVVGTGNQPCCRMDTGFDQCGRFRSPALYKGSFWFTGNLRCHLDNDYFYFLFLQTIVDCFTKTAITANHPAPFYRRIDRLIEALVRHTSQPLMQQIHAGCLQRRRQARTKGIVRINNVIRAKRSHIGLDIF